MEKEKAKQTKIYIVMLGIMAIAIIYWFLWGTIGASRESEYIQEIIHNAMPFCSIDLPTDKYYSEIIPYDELSYRYRNVISKEEYESADTDEEIYSLYQKIIKAGDKISAEKRLSTSGYRQGTAYEMIIIGETKYMCCHDIVIALNPFTLRPYIYKWEMECDEIHE